MEQSIAQYKDNDEDNDIHNLAYFFKTLSINMFKNFLSNIYVTDKLFLILLNAISNIKSINTIDLLANSAFKYQMIFANKTAA